VARTRKWANTPLKGLGKALRQKAPEGSPGPREPEPVPTEPDPPSEEELFLKAMSDVREIPGFRKLPPASGPGKFTRKAREEDPVHELRRIVQKKAEIRLPDIDEYDEWVSGGESAELAGRLHSGECSVQDFIDLHGLTGDEAVAELTAFLEVSRRRGLGCVKVIHGRGLRSPGEPVLKSAVARLLKGALSKHVRAYSTAHPKDGGLGATYVLLKGR
jgi:DNA-nicking Smr family endonuclease